MSDSLRMQRLTGSHVTLAYKDEDEEDRDAHQQTSLLPSSSLVRQTSKERSCACLKRIIVVLSIIAICVGAFEIAFNGKEAESLHAAQNKIYKLKLQLSQAMKGGFDLVKASTASALPYASGDQDARNDQSSVFTPSLDPQVEALKSRSVIVLKTGASVLFDRLPLQLLLAQDAFNPEIYDTGRAGDQGPSFFVYSDADIQIGPFAVHDALANVSEVVRNEKEFSERYNSLHTMLSSGDDLRASNFNQGWNLDKWKFLYMWQDAFKRDPNADWYIGYEADTFVLWESLFKFLVTQDARKEQLFGCPSILLSKMELFANGGCPYVISGALMRASYGKDPQFASKFDSEVKVSCCGDAELSIALRKSATKEIKHLGDAGSRFQGERPLEILFNQDNWCEPIFNFHHLKTEEVQWLSSVERDIRATKQKNETILYSDVFTHIIPPSLKKALHSLEHSNNHTFAEVELNPIKEDWEAFGSSEKGVKQGRRTEDVENCKAQCIKSKDCTTWFWIKVTENDSDGDCYLLHDAIKIGKSYQGTGLRTSGWLADRVANFKAHHFCKHPPTA
ncbi:uncharacterized protein MEPE_04147 [Melanopsichium pennsylvanicum]|uniref:Glycosyltransferase family 31 protein n=2 Tax=Melanopsichium pennsylvanicum TaxID=63383 RepID=A0AAJ5C6D9_9BASI|nr:conserved hypothetical protein [Melanopsichium pennsylvanicum 4]SNX85438.1 uncharacterized protein MEPE_04147 [Melanopsichium pennsylvanicum]